MCKNWTQNTKCYSRRESQAWESLVRCQPQRKPAVITGRGHTGACITKLGTKIGLLLEGSSAVDCMCLTRGLNKLLMDSAVIALGRTVLRETKGFLWRLCWLCSQDWPQVRLLPAFLGSVLSPKRTVLRALILLSIVILISITFNSTNSIISMLLSSCYVTCLLILIFDLVISLLDTR